MKWNLNITSSKFASFAMLCMAFALSWKLNDPTIFMFAVPFFNFIITGKQYLDRNGGRQ